MMSEKPKESPLDCGNPVREFSAPHEHKQTCPHGEQASAGSLERIIYMTGTGRPIGPAQRERIYDLAKDARGCKAARHRPRGSDPPDDGGRDVAARVWVA